MVFTSRGAPPEPQHTRSAVTGMFVTVRAAVGSLGLDLTGAQFKSVQHGALRLLTNEVKNLSLGTFVLVVLPNRKSLQYKMLPVCTDVCQAIYVFPLPSSHRYGL